MTISRSTKIRLSILVAGTALLVGVIEKSTHIGYTITQSGELRITQSAHQPNIKRVIKEQGWEIPGLKQSRMVGARHLFEGYGEKPAPIYSTGFKPNQEVVAEVHFYGLLGDGEVLAITERSISIRSIARYDVNKKVFCYFVRGVGAFYDKKTGHGGYGGEYGFLYYDNDGDGKFESFEQGGHIPPFVPQVPKWVLK